MLKSLSIPAFMYFKTFSFFNNAENWLSFKSLVSFKRNSLFGILNCFELIKLLNSKSPVRLFSLRLLINSPILFSLRPVFSSSSLAEVSVVLLSTPTELLSVTASFDKLLSGSIIPASSFINLKIFSSAAISILPCTSTKSGKLFIISLKMFFAAEASFCNTESRALGISSTIEDNS